MVRKNEPPTKATIHLEFQLEFAYQALSVAQQQHSGLCSNGPGGHS